MTIDMILIEPERYLDLSTGHVTANDSLLINKYQYVDNLHLYVLSDYDKLWMIKIPGYNNSGKYQREQISNLKRAGFSKDFLNIVRLMFYKKCDRLCLDCDGPQYDSLPLHDW